MALSDSSIFTYETIGHFSDGVFVTYNRVLMTSTCNMTTTTTTATMTQDNAITIDMYITAATTTSMLQYHRGGVAPAAICAIRMERDSVEWVNHIDNKNNRPYDRHRSSQQQTQQLLTLMNFRHRSYANRYA
jgi:hypothetical protein